MPLCNISQFIFLHLLIGRQRIFGEQNAHGFPLHKILALYDRLVAMANALVVLHYRVVEGQAYKKAAGAKRCTINNTTFACTSFTVLSTVSVL